MTILPHRIAADRLAIVAADRLSSYFDPVYEMAAIAPRGCLFLHSAASDP